MITGRLLPASLIAIAVTLSASCGGGSGDGVDLSDHIKAIDLDAIHRELEAGERDIVGRPVGLKVLEPFEVTLSGYWEGATVGKG